MSTPKLFSPLRNGLRAWLIAAAALVAAIGGCGGGVGTGGTGGFASGPITGFGSVIVNDVHYQVDEAATRVEDADGTLRISDELRLGMTVEVDSGAITGTPSATTIATANASRIHFESALRGLVTTVDAAGGSFTLLGQRVAVDATTVFDESLAGGLDGLAAGRAVEVYAVYDTAASRFRATRVEAADSGIAPRLRGPLAAVDTGTQVLRIGSTDYGYAGASDIPVTLQAGQFVRLRLELATQPLRWVVKSFGAPQRSLPDADAVKLKGLITSFASAASFSVDGRPVVTSAATSFPDGSAGLANGVRVEAQGVVRNGVLQATKVSIETDEQEVDRGFELSGNISAVNAAQQTFVLRRQTISTARAGLVYEDGTAADLVVIRKVEVRGRLSADRLRVEATRIKFD